MVPEDELGRLGAEGHRARQVQGAPDIHVDLGLAQYPRLRYWKTDRYVKPHHARARRGLQKPDWSSESAAHLALTRGRLATRRLRVNQLIRREISI